MENLIAQVANPVLGGGLGSGWGYFNTIVPRLINIGFIVAAVVFVFIFIFGAFGWITAGGDKGKLAEARARITHAIVGLLILLIIYFIVQLVNYILGLNIGGIGGPFNPPGATPPIASQCDPTTSCASWQEVWLNNCNSATLYESTPRNPLCQTQFNTATLHLLQPGASTYQIVNVPNVGNICDTDVDYSGVSPIPFDIDGSMTFSHTLLPGAGEKKVCARFTDSSGTASCCGGMIEVLSGPGPTITPVPGQGTVTCTCQGNTVTRDNCTVGLNVATCMSPNLCACVMADNSLVVENQISGNSCADICQDDYGRSCSDVGIDTWGLNGLYRRYTGSICANTSGDCNTLIRSTPTFVDPAYPPVAWDGNIYCDQTKCHCNALGVGGPPFLPPTTSTPFPLPTLTPIPTATPRPTNTPTQVPTATPRPTATNTPVPTATPRPTNTPTPIPTSTSSPLPGITNTPTPTPPIIASCTDSDGGLNYTTWGFTNSVDGSGNFSSRVDNCAGSNLVGETYCQGNLSLVQQYNCSNISPSHTCVSGECCVLPGNSCTTNGDCCMGNVCNGGTCQAASNIILNEATGISCYDLCWLNGFQGGTFCQSVGTNATADNGMSYVDNCSLTNINTCTHGILASSFNTLCNGHRTNWTYCNCVPNATTL